MEPEGSLLHSQMPTTCPYPEPAKSSPYLTSHFLEIHLKSNLYIYFLKRYIAQTVYTGCTKINYKIVSVTNFDKYVLYGTCRNE